MKTYRNKQTDRVDRQNVQSYSKILIYMSIIIQLTYLHTLYKSLFTNW